jgi:hypothetical protein
MTCGPECCLLRGCNEHIPLLNIGVFLDTQLIYLNY